MIQPLHTSFRLLWAGLAAGALAGAAHSQDVKLAPEATRWRLSLTQAFTDGPEDLGLLGLHYGMFDPFPTLPNVHLGLTTYVGTWGELGGYFASGLEAGWRHPLGGDWSAEIGLFAGGGGAFGVDDGTGPLLRPHVALEHPLSRTWNWRLELGYAAAPGGDLDGVQIGLGVSASRELLTADWSFAELAELPVEALLEIPQQIDASIVHVDPSSGSSRTGRPAREFQMLALRTHFAVGRNLYVPIEYASAIHGDSGGFRQLMLGLGEWGPRFTPRVWGVKELLIGAGGGSGYDTGGGLLGQANAGLVIPFADGWSAHVKGGYEWSFGGDFDAWVLHVGASWAPRYRELPRDFDRTAIATSGLSMDDVDLDPYVVSLKHKTVAPARDARDESGAPLTEDLQLVGVGLEREMLDSFDLMTNLFTAWDGDVGGYQEVQLGARYRLEVFRPWQTTGEIYLQYLIGSGNGGVDNRSGMFHEFGAGWRFSPAAGMWICIEASRTESESGSYEGDTFGFHVGWAFARAQSF